MLSNPSGLNLSATAGKFYYGVNSVESPAFNTETGTTLEYYYRNASGLGYNDTHQNTINNTYYDDGSGNPIIMSNNKFKTEFVFIELSSNAGDEFSIVMGQNQWNSLAEAQVENVPSTLPNPVSKMGVLVGRLIIQKSDATPSSVDSAFVTQFTPAVANTHNLLAGIQGGSVNEYYHLNSTQYTNIINSILPTVQPSSPSLGSIFYNTTSHTTNCYDGGWRYCGNGSFV